MTYSLKFFGPGFDSRRLHHIYYARKVIMVITDKAVSKVKEMADEQGLKGHGLRLVVIGGGCSGFTYDMNLENHFENPNATSTCGCGSSFAV